MCFNYVCSDDMQNKFFIWKQQLKCFPLIPINFNIRIIQKQSIDFQSNNPAFLLYVANTGPKYWSIPPEVFSGKGVLKICSKLIGEHSCRSVISVKLLWSVIEITLWHKIKKINVQYWKYPRSITQASLIQNQELKLNRRTTYVFSHSPSKKIIDNLFKQFLPYVLVFVTSP